MCGRFSFSSSREKLQKQFGDLEVDTPLELSFNIAPTQQAYVITNEAPHHLQRFYWGLLPYWSKEGALSGKLINARCEGIASKPSFRAPLRRRRCWVPADSFYEWRAVGRQKIPYRILPRREELLVFAGIWEVWRQGDQAIHTFSIITGPPNKEVSRLHNRMPIILTTPEKQERWLLSDDLDEIQDLLQPAPDNSLEFYRVSTDLNSPRNNSPELHQRVEDDWAELPDLE